MSFDSSPSTPGGGREAARPGLARVSSSHPDSPPISTGPLPTSSTPAPEVEEGEPDLGDSVSLSSVPGFDPGFCAMNRREGGRVGAVGAASLPLSEARGAPARAPSARSGGLSGLRASCPTPVARLAPFSDPPSESVPSTPPPAAGAGSGAGGKRTSGSHRSRCSEAGAVVSIRVTPPPPLDPSVPAGRATLRLLCCTSRT